MFNNNKNDYFEMMETLMAFSTRAAKMLLDHLTDYQPEQAKAQREEIHKIEHEADEAKHMTLRKLSREFITPIERDDIFSLVQIIDDVTDAIDEVAINLYMYNIRTIPQEAISLAAMVERCSIALAEAIKELRDFKHSTTLDPLIVKINTIESDADKVYIEAMRSLMTSAHDPMMVMGIREIYDCLESCCDLCEHAADVIENTVMMNS